MKSGPRELQAYHLEQLAREAKKGTNMTRTMEPPAPWEQLNISEEEFNERQAKIDKIAHGANPSDAPALTPTEKTRKKRSDAGKPKPKKPEPTAQAGGLTNAQADELRDLASLTYAAREEEREACEAYEEACIRTTQAINNFNNRLAALTAK